LEVLEQRPEEGFLPDALHGDDGADDPLILGQLPGEAADADEEWVRQHSQQVVVGKRIHPSDESA
jgi:hypothetical protein